MTTLTHERTAAVAGDQDREFGFTAWLSVQCPICEEGGGGVECDDHVIQLETQLKRWLDA